MQKIVSILLRNEKKRNRWITRIKAQIGFCKFVTKASFVTVKFIGTI